MPNLMPPGALSGMVPQMVQRPPSQAEVDETLRVRAMQVRTEAVRAAASVLAGHAPDPTVVTDMAAALAEFITSG